MDMKSACAEKERIAERDRLLSLSQTEVDRLPVPERYQRMRHEREIEGNEYVSLLRRGMDRARASETARENARSIISCWQPGNVP